MRHVMCQARLADVPRQLRTLLGDDCALLGGEVTASSEHSDASRATVEEDV